MPQQKAPIDLTELAAFVARTPYDLIDTDGDPLVRIDGHRPFAWPALREKRWLFLDAPSSTRYEPVGSLVLSYLLRQRGVRTLYDLGAGIGYFSMLAASFEAAPVTAHAFEIQPRAIERLQAWAAANAATLPGRVVPHLAGLSDRHEGEKTIWYSITRMFEEKPDEAAVRESWHRRLKFRLKGRPDRAKLKEAVVTVTSIDHIVAETGETPGLLKIDVDGYEGKVIAGARDTLAQARPYILLELHNSRYLGRFGRTRREIVAELIGHGYRAVFLTNHHFVERNSFVEVGADHPLVAREHTDMLLFC